jgi:phospholipid/cholesterol/gamma-HCH transport system substrate-binding protein
MPVGQVDHLELEEGGVKVHIKLTKAIIIRETYKIRPESSSLLGGMQLVIDEGTGEPMPLDTLFRGESPENVMDNINGAVTDIRQSLNEGGIRTNLENAVADISELTRRLREGEGTLGKLLSTNDTVYADLQETIADIRAIADRVEKGEGTIGKLLSSDSTVYDDLQETIADIRSIADRVEKGEGTLGKLLSSDDSMYTDLHDTIANLKTITGRLENGEGALGQLMRDDGELTLELGGFLKDGRDMLDDLRETSPVSTFSSIFFGAL